mgnify:FL=1
METSVAARFYRAGWSRVPERWAVPGGSMQLVDVPDLCTLIEHPTEGLGLFDTGTSEAFAGNTRRFSLEAYRHVTQHRMTRADTVRAQLEHDGLQASEIRWIVLSHLDPDHSGGLRDFPNARIICSRAVRDLADAHSLGAALRGRLFPNHLPLDFAERAAASPETGPPLAPFPWSHDLFGDGSIVLVPLPGHAIGQIGALLRVDSGERWFLVADAIWSIEGLSRRGFFHEIIAVDRTAQDATRRDLAAFAEEHDVLVLPSHCLAAARRMLGPQNP